MPDELKLIVSRQEPGLRNKLPLLFSEYQRRLSVLKKSLLSPRHWSNDGSLGNIASSRSRPNGRSKIMMMGIEQRHFSPLENISLEELVPKDHFYRRLDAMLDLSFVRELVAERYAASSGRPSVDPVASFFACSWSCSSRTSAASASS
jgi:hypothetical protein